MTYQEATDYLFNQLPQYQIMGPGAYKPGLDTARALDDLTGNPHRRYPTIHVAGTNGKGSVASSLAAVARAAGLRTGLYTSPHLLDFRERIRVNGEMITPEAVAGFVERFRDNDLHPSFFELTTAMALEYFAKENVDIAIIEVGLGGRLDSTNIITPELSVITNISLDHTALLGNTPAAIASEKAGIIKPGVPVVIGEAPDPEVHRVFADKAKACGSKIVFADEIPWFDDVRRVGHKLHYSETPWGNIACDLTGDCQPLNMATTLAALSLVGWADENAVKKGLAHVCGYSGLAGRWQIVGTKPLTVADTGHNSGGWQYLARQIDKSVTGRKRLVLGFVNDKDLEPIKKELSAIGDAEFYFTRPSVSRGLPPEELAAEMEPLKGRVFDSVEAALATAGEDAAANDMIFVGGSTFVVADFLASRASNYEKY